MASEDGSVKIKVNMDISDVTAGVHDIGGQLKKAGLSVEKSGEAIRKALTGAVDTATGKAIEKTVYGLGAKVGALGTTYQKALAGNKAAMDTFQAKAADIVESAGRLRNALAQLGEIQIATPELEALDQAIEKAQLRLDDGVKTIGDRMGELEGQMVPTEALRALDKEIGVVNASLNTRMATLSQYESLGVSTDSDKWKKTEESAERLREKLAALNEQRAKLDESGGAYQLGTESEEYRQLEAQLHALEAAYDGLLEKRKELIASGAGYTNFAEAAEFKGMETSLDAVTGRLTGMQERLVEAAINAAAARREIEALAAAEAAAQEEAAQQAEAAQTTAWERFKQHLTGAAASMGLVRRQTDDTSGAMATLRTSAGAAASGMSGMFKKVLKWGLGIRSTFILVRKLRTAVKEGLTTMARHDKETADTLNNLKTALTNVKLSLASAFAPILTAVAPLLEKLCTLATRAANAVARFFAILSGRGSYTRVTTSSVSTISSAMGGVAVASVSATKNVSKMASGLDAAKTAASGTADGISAASKAAADAAQNLSGLDELNIWQSNKDSSGGGGGGGDDLGVSAEEVPVEPWDFVVRLKDILFQWDDLNPELIAEKILTGLCAAAGGIIGYSLGGVAGGLVGLTLGALLGVKLSQITFDGDGAVDKGEAAKLFLAAAVGLIGAIVGGIAGSSGILSAVVGGPAGAAIGLTLGVAVTLRLLSVTQEEINKNAENTMKNYADTISPKVGIETLVSRVDQGLMTQEEALEAIHDAYGVVIDDYGVLADAVHWGTDLPEELTDAMPKGKWVEFKAKLKDDSKEWWSNLKTWWNDKVGPVKEFWTNVKNDAKDWWKNVKSWWGKKVGSVKEFTTNVANKASDWWKSVKSWWGKKVGAVKEFTTNAANQASAWWSNVKTWWSGKVGTVKNFTTGVTNQASTWWSSVKNWWSGTVGSVKEFTTSVTNQASTWWASVKNWWSGKVGAAKNFTTGVTNSAATWWGNVQNWWGAKVGAVKNFTTSVSNTASTWWANVKSWWNEKSSGGVTFTAKITSFTDALKNKTLEFKAKITSFIDAIGEKVLNFTAKIGNFFGLGGSSSSSSSAYSGAGRKATGGIYKNGRWYPVEGYASGGNPRSGRLFIANENGMPELVGTIGGHTAVMNNGQIVSSVAAGVYRAVAAAMGQVGGWFRAMSGALSDIPPAIELLANMPAQVPQPVLAAGTVLPPKAVYADGPVQGLADAVSGLRSALERQGPGGETPIVVNVYVDGQLDGKSLFRAVATEARIQRRASGKDPFAG